MYQDPFKEYIKQAEPSKKYKGYAWSTAIGLQAVDGLEKNGSPKPLFETDDERTSFAATIFIHPKFNQQTSDQTIQTTIRTTQTTNQTNNETIEEQILFLVKHNPRVTQVQLAYELNVPQSTIKYYIRKLSKSQIIKREGTVHNGKWIIL